MVVTDSCATAKWQFPYSIVNKAQVVLSYSCFNAFLISLIQTSQMKHALPTMVGVPTFVPATQMEILSAAAELDTDWMAMVETAMVRTVLTVSHVIDKQICKSRFALVCYITDV